MRLMAWPSYQVWFHVSLAGICLVPYAFFCFIRDFCGHSAKGSHRIWLVLIVLVNLYNMATSNLLGGAPLRKSGRRHFLFTI